MKRGDFFISSNRYISSQMVQLSWLKLDKS